MKFSEKAQKAIVVAESIAFNLGHQNVGSEHLLLSLLKMHDISLSKILKKYQVEDSQIESELIRLFGKSDEQLFYMEYTNIFKHILENAMALSKARKESKVSIETLSLALLEEDESVSHELLIGYELPIAAIKEELRQCKKSGNELSKIHDLINLNEKVKKNQPILVGREEELQALIEILCRKEKNNALIVGDAGVGKTALVEKLAIEINQMTDKHHLSGKTIYELDLASVVAGTKYRGEFEDKLKKIIEQVRSDGDAIVFIDEIHNLVGAGGAEGAIDASNILKPYLARGEITCIGATTYEEYRRYFEKDRALNRRFAKIDLKEEDNETTLKILRKLKIQFEKYHHVSIPESTLQKIVEYSSRYIKERHQPDISIDVLDLACVKSTMIDQKEVSIEVAIEVIEKMTGMNLHQEKPLEHLKDVLKKRIHGQEQVIHQLISHLSLVDAGFYSMTQPKSVLLFAGATGVGKTQMAKIIAQNYYGHLIRLDLSEFKEAHTISKIIGSPPGYVGYEQSSRFLDEVRRYPHSVILLDEIDKAHKDVLHLFLQIFDEGSIEDSQKNKVDFTNTMIIMTSNMGFQFSNSQAVGFHEKNSFSKTKTLLENHFTPEFLNRVDDIFYFERLTKSACEKIIDDYLDNFCLDESLSRLCDEVWKEKVIDSCEIEKYGARALQRKIRQSLCDLYSKQPS